MFCDCTIGNMGPSGCLRRPTTKFWFLINRSNNRYFYYQLCDLCTIPDTWHKDYERVSITKEQYNFYHILK
jgi:hypothetical protein